MLNPSVDSSCSFCIDSNDQDKFVKEQKLSFLDELFAHKVIGVQAHFKDKIQNQKQISKQLRQTLKFTTPPTDGCSADVLSLMKRMVKNLECSGCLGL